MIGDRVHPLHRVAVGQPVRQRIQAEHEEHERGNRRDGRRARGALVDCAHYGIKRYFSTRNSSRAATPGDPFFIISSISAISRGSCETHSRPCVVTM